MSGDSTNSNGSGQRVGQMVAWALLTAVLGITVTSVYWIFDSISVLRYRMGQAEVRMEWNSENIRGLLRREENERRR